MLIGAHVPTSLGYEKMTAYAEEVGCECIQIFAKSPRQWNAKPLDEKLAASLRELCDSHGVGPVLTHTAYLINLSTNKEELRQKSIAALADELRRGTMLGADGVNSHIGNDPQNDWQKAAHIAASSIVAAFEAAGGTKGCSKLILENSAGQGSSFGNKIEELSRVIDETGLPVDDIGICIDTCHAWAAGYDMSTYDGWKYLLDAIDSSLGIERLRWIHANDCKFGRGLAKDRHEWIGKGEIGEAGFAAMFEFPEIDHVNIVTEMPGEMPEKDIRNIKLLKKLREDA